MADVVEKKSASLGIEFIQDTVVADAKTAFAASGQPMMRISCKAGAHVVHFTLHGPLNGRGEFIERITVST
jgi:hypothetical protein